MIIFSQGNTEEYLAHILAVLHLMNQKGLGMRCRKLAKSAAKLAGTLENLQKPNGPQGSSSKEDQEACIVRDAPRSLEGSQRGCCQDVGASEEPPVQQSADPMGSGFLRDVKARIVSCSEWSNDQRKHPHLWIALRDCLELHKLTALTADVGKRQRFYIQQAVHKPQRATVPQHISCMGVLNDFFTYLLMLEDSPMAESTTNKGNVPFSKADLVAIILVSIPMTW